MIQPAISVRDLVILQRDADMQSSYKPALLKALVRLVRTDPAPAYTRTQIARQFLSLYWNQTIVYHLRQAPSLAREPVVLRAIRFAAERHRVRRLADLPPGAVERLIARLASALPVVLKAFHASAPGAMPPLFTWTSPESIVMLSAPGFRSLAEHGAELELIANHWWARYLERVNKLAPYVIRKVEREGAERGSLTTFLHVLRQLDTLTCFYCDRRLDESVVTHVDHVLPWAFLLEDELWDLVLACAPCNLAKSDRLPDRSFVDRLQRRNERHAQTLLRGRNISAFVQGVDLYRLYDSALALEWPGPWLPAAGALA